MSQNWEDSCALISLPKTWSLPFCNFWQNITATVTSNWIGIQYGIRSMHYNPWGEIENARGAGGEEGLTCRSCRLRSEMPGSITRSRSAASRARRSGAASPWASWRTPFRVSAGSRSQIQRPWGVDQEASFGNLEVRSVGLVDWSTPGSHARWRRRGRPSAGHDVLDVELGGSSKSQSMKANAS